MILERFESSVLLFSAKRLLPKAQLTISSYISARHCLPHRGQKFCPEVCETYREPRF